MKVKYTITIVQTEDPANWDADTCEEVIPKIKQYLKQDPGYLDSAEWESVEVEKIEEGV